MSPLDIQEFLSRREELPVVDVRSPAEFAHAHMRGAVSLPLFSDDERAQVGTAYKEVGREAATLAGLGIVGPQLESLARRALEIARSAGTVELLVHCWRGGMRSGSMAWLFETAGLRALTLEGGYKAYRRAMLETVAAPRPLLLVGGKTGAGKTELLALLRSVGEQTIDLEDLAKHRGSSFGSLGYGEQPSTEQFQNEIGEEWLAFDPSRRTWLEDESQKVGRNFITDQLYGRMKEAPMVLVEAPLQERIARLVREYGGFDTAALREATVRIRKRLGGERTARAVRAIEEGDLGTAVSLILDYYDRAYVYGVETRHRGPVISVTLSGSPAGAVASVLDAARRLEGTHFEGSGSRARF